MLTFHYNILQTVASNCDDSTTNCVDKMKFLSALDSLKEQQKTSKSEITLFVDENSMSDEIEKIMKNQRYRPSSEKSGR